MITEQDLQEAIAECQGEKNPNASTCMKLAAFYTIRNELYPAKSAEPVIRGYSYAPPPEAVGNTITYESDTEFGRTIRGRSQAEIWPIVDELVSDALRVVNPRLYAAFLRKIRP